LKVTLHYKLQKKKKFHNIQALFSETIPKSKRVLEIVSAQKLKAVDKGNTSDPFCLITYGNKNKDKTAIVKKNLNPVWNHKIYLNEDSPSPLHLYLEVWDHNVFKDVFLGQIDIDLDLSSNFSNFYPLFPHLDKNKEKGITGSVQIKVYKE